MVVNGEHFEILVNPDAALSFKQGKKVEPSQVLVADEVYSDASKGLRASDDKLRKAFQTEDHTKAAFEILRRGELQLTQEQRKRDATQRSNDSLAALPNHQVGVQPGTQ